MDSVQDTRRKNWGWFYYDLVDQWGPIIGANGLAVMMVLTRHADNDSRAAWPSYATIAEKTGLSRRQVMREIAKLAEHRLIRVTARPGASAHDHGSNLYTLLPLPSDTQSLPSDTVTPSLVTHSHQPSDTQSPKQDLVNYTQKNERDDAPARPQGPYPATPVSGDRSTDPDWDNVGHATPKGTPIQLRPDRPAVHAVPKPGDDPALDADWATLVATFPHRDGAGKVHRPKDTRLAWTLAGPGRRAQILTGARHLATGSKDAQEGFGPHLLDFIQQETYTLWQTPATPRPARSHTDPTRPPAPTYRILNAPAASA